MAWHCVAGTAQLVDNVKMNAAAARKELVVKQESETDLASLLGSTREELLASPGVTPELIAYIESCINSPEVQAIDRMLLNEARSAFQAAGCSVLEFLAANPGVSKFELAKRLAKRANESVRVVGLVRLIYDEAAKAGVVREIAKDLLLREINDAFPNGWSSGDEIGPLVKIGSWADPIHEHIRNLAFSSYARSIIKHLAVNHQPPDGWKPKSQSDPLIDELFDRYWPAA